MPLSGTNRKLNHQYWIIYISYTVNGGRNSHDGDGGAFSCGTVDVLCRSSKALGPLRRLVHFSTFSALGHGRKLRFLFGNNTFIYEKRNINIIVNIYSVY